MKDVIDLLYFVFGSIFVIGVLNLLFDCFKLLIKAKNEKPPAEMILKFMDIAGDITMMKVGI